MLRAKFMGATSAGWANDAGLVAREGATSWTTTVLRGFASTGADGTARSGAVFRAAALGGALGARDGGLFGRGGGLGARTAGSLELARWRGSAGNDRRPQPGQGAAAPRTTAIMIPKESAGEVRRILFPRWNLSRPPRGGPRTRAIELSVA